MVVHPPPRPMSRLCLTAPLLPAMKPHIVSNLIFVFETETSRDVSEMKKHFEKLKVLFKQIIDAKESNMLIDTNFENVANETNIAQFIAATEISLKSLEELQTLLLTRCSDVILFFGEEEGSSVQHMCTMLAEFIAGYAQSKKKFEDNLRKESRLKAAAAKKAAALTPKH